MNDAGRDGSGSRGRTRITSRCGQVCTLSAPRRGRLLDHPEIDHVEQTGCGVTARRARGRVGLRGAWLSRRGRPRRFAAAAATSPKV